MVAREVQIAIIPKGEEDPITDIGRHIMYHLHMPQMPDQTLQRYTRVVQKVLQMLGFHRYKRLILAKFVMLE